MSTLSVQRILIPTDMSDFGATALRWAGMLERRIGAKITVLYANQPYVPFDILEGPAAYALQTAPELRERLARDLREYVEIHLPDLAIAADTLVVDDAPARAILETAKSIDADLIVMATHGRSGWRRALLGSVTENVVHHTDRAVLCIPPADVRGEPPAIGKILCPVNFTPIGRMALDQAATLAVTFDAELLVVHVADALDAGSDLAEGFAAWIEPDTRSRCRYSHMIASGDAAEETLRMADDSGADLIVLGMQHKRFADTTVIGTTTERVLRFAKQPVLTVIEPAFSRRLKDVAVA